MIELNKGNILVIEDDPKNMKLIKAVLQRGNYAVLEAENADDGIEMARKYHPDVILMDIQLPGINGWDATRLIKSDPELKNIPVVAVTSSAMVGDEEKALEAGCAGHISKPIDVHSFVDTMEQLVTASRPFE